MHTVVAVLMQIVGILTLIAAAAAINLYAGILVVGAAMLAVGLTLESSQPKGDG